MITHADTLLGRVSCVNPVEARQVYPITPDGQLQTREAQAECQACKQETEEVLV